MLTSTITILIFFLQSLPKNLINISHETKEPVVLKETIENKSQRGVFQSYADTQKHLLESDAWKNHILEKYRKDMND